MHLVQRDHVDTLDQAAHALGVTPTALKADIATNIRGGAAVLRADALALSPTHTLPTSLADWYGAVASYSDAATTSTARMYADALYKLLKTGFSARAENGETITLAPQAVRPNTATAARVTGTTALPAGCSNDGNVDYPDAIDCILNPNVYDCNIVSPGSSTNPCSYEDSNRPATFSISFVVIHDVEGTALDAINTFQNINDQRSCNYVVDSDGTVYQVVREKDIAYHAGNYWYNQHSVGIEHAGYDATGYQWYNATEYLASAKLTAYLLKKYSLPLDHAHVVAHGTIPGPSLQYTPNHVDPGPYWLWDYYFSLINQQGVPFPVGTPPLNTALARRVFILHPSTDQQPLGSNGSETSANFNFFYLYNGPSTQSGLIPHAVSDITEVTDNYEPNTPFYFVAAQPDQAGTGDTMYEVWYGESDNLPNEYMNGHLGWLAVPPGAAVFDTLTYVGVTSANGATINIYGRPTTSSTYIIGNAPGNAIFSTTLSVVEDGTSNVWYEIDYNHRQSWVPASEITVFMPRS